MQSIISNRKVYKEKAFSIGTFLGGPLVAGYFFAENFKALGKPQYIRNTWLITIIAVIVIFSGVFLIPDDLNIPNQLIPLIYSGIAYGLYKKFQSDDVDRCLEKDGENHSWWNVIAVGFSGLCITILLVVFVMFSIERLQHSNFSTLTYGEDVVNEISFNSSDVTENEIDQIAKFFIEKGFFDNDVPKYIHVNKDINTYEISIFISPGIEKNIEIINALEELRHQMDDRLFRNQIAFKLIVNDLDNVVKEIK